MKSSFAAFLLFASARLLQAAGASYSMDVNLAPMRDVAEKNAYVYTATVTDLETGEPLSSPTLTLLADGPAEITTEGEDVTVKFKVVIESAQSRATSEITVLREGKVVASQKTSMAIH